MSGRAATPWTHLPVSVAFCSCLARQLPTAPLTGTWAQRAGAHLGRRAGHVRAMRRAQERGGEGTGRVKRGRRAAHACAIGPACGRGRCARGGSGCGRGARTSDSISTTLPHRAVEELEEEVGPRVGGQSGGSDPADRCTWVGRWGRAGHRTGSGHGARAACARVLLHAHNQVVQALLLGHAMLRDGMRHVAPSGANAANAFAALRANQFQSLWNCGWACCFSSSLRGAHTSSRGVGVMIPVAVLDPRHHSLPSRGRTNRIFCDSSAILQPPRAVGTPRQHLSVGRNLKSCILQEPEDCVPSIALSFVC